MNLSRLALANVVALRRRLFGLVTLVALAASCCLAALGIASQAQGASDTGVKESDTNRSITVERPEERPDASPLTEKAVAKIARLPKVDSVQHKAQVSFAYKDGDVQGVLLYATTHRPALSPPLTDSTRADVFPLKPGEIVLPARAQGEDLGELLGSRITVDTTRYVSDGQGTGATDRVRVVGLYDPSWQLDGADAAYADDATVVRWAAAKSGVPADSYLSTVGYNQLTVMAANSEDVAQVRDAVQRLGFPATTLDQQLAELPAVLELIRWVGLVLLGVLGLLAFAGAMTVTGALARQRVREIGILKAVGFRNRYVLTLLVVEMAMVGAVAALLGLLGGALFSGAGAGVLRNESELGDYVTALVPLPTTGNLLMLLGATVVVVVAGAVLPARRAAKLSPTEAMKDW